MQRAIPPLLLLITISCASLFFRLGSLPLSGADEPRYARIAEEMRAHGNLVTPLLEGKSWLEKPPLYYWLTIAAYSIFGVNETAARLGPAFCALITALAIFWLGSRLWSIRAGCIGAAILLTSLGFIGFGRSASTDMAFTCFLTLFGALQLDAVLGSTRLSPGILLAYVFLGLAVLAKGPIALILAAGILVSAWYLDERGGLFRKWHVITGIMVTAAVSIPWFLLIFRQNGFAFISTFFINHNLARYLTGIHHHSQPFYYYLPVLLALLFPWSGWLPLLISRSPLKALRRWRKWDIRMVFLSCWFLFPILFFSISDSKLAGYILPSFPPLALILGVHISQSTDRSRLQAAAVMDLLLSAGLAIAAPLVFQREYGGAWRTGLLLSATILMPAVFSIVFKFRGKYLQASAATLLQGLMIVIVLAQSAFPVLAAYHSTRDIAHRALALQRSGEPIITYRFFHHSLQYYTGYRVAGKLDDSGSLIQFVRGHPAALVVTDVPGMNKILSLKDIHAVTLADQGSFRLMRLTARTP